MAKITNACIILPWNFKGRVHVDRVPRLCGRTVTKEMLQKLVTTELGHSAKITSVHKQGNQEWTTHFHLNRLLILFYIITFMKFTIILHSAAVTGHVTGRNHEHATQRTFSAECSLPSGWSSDCYWSDHIQQDWWSRHVARMGGYY
jgi:hypothetical protein